MQNPSIGCLLVLVLTSTQIVVPLPAQTTSTSSTCPTFEPGTLCSSQQPPYCGDSCDNYPFCPTTCWPTDAGPAWGGAEGSGQGMLYCAKAIYANCHYSGPPWPTGTNPDNIPLPCQLNEEGTLANCKCQVFEGESYVNISGIMNLGAYYETVAVCGSDGSSCQNITTCPPGSNGDCEGEIPPVCQYITGQSQGDPETSLIPGADLISTFGFDMEDNYPSGSTQCTDLLVAGCMSAPCQYDDTNSESGPQYAQCACPTSVIDSFSLSQSNQNCDPGEGYVWE